MNRSALAALYHLNHDVEYVTVSTGTTHLRKPQERRALCGKLIPLDGPKIPRYHTDPGTVLTCQRCRTVTERATQRAQSAKRAK